MLARRDRRHAGALVVAGLERELQVLGPEPCREPLDGLQRCLVLALRGALVLRLRRDLGCRRERVDPSDGKPLNQNGVPAESLTPATGLAASGTTRPGLEARGYAVGAAERNARDQGGRQRRTIRKRIECGADVLPAASVAVTVAR